LPDTLGIDPNPAEPAITSPLSFSRTRLVLGTNQAGTGLADTGGHRCPCPLRASPTLKRTKRETTIFSPQLGDFGLDQLVDGERGLLDERLLVEAHGFIELLSRPSMILSRIFSGFFSARAAPRSISRSFSSASAVTSSFRTN